MKCRCGMAILLAAIFGLVLSAPAFAANVLYTQAFDQTGIGNASQDDVGGLGLYAQVYDNFSLSADSNVQEVQFAGFYLLHHGDIESWNVQFYGDNKGQPGMLLATKNINGNGNEAFLGNFNGVQVYTYDLPGLAFSAAANTKYWLSVYPDLGFPPQWDWATSAEGDGIAYQDYFGSRNQLSNDQAFTLIGTPEPGTLVMLGTGVLGLAGAIRRSLV